LRNKISKCESVAIRRRNSAHAQVVDVCLGIDEHALLKEVGPAGDILYRVVAKGYEEVVSNVLTNHTTLQTYLQGTLVQS
jgi:hypothetical protein